MKRSIGTFLLTIILLTNITYAENIGIEDSVRAYLISDYRTGEIVKEYNSEQTVEIASITKLMTYLVTMDEIESGKISLKDRVIMDDDSLVIGGSTLKIRLGESFTVDELLDMALVVSANNAAHRLSRHVAGTESNFVKMMNRKANDIGLEDAVFYNSTGLPIRGIEDQNKMRVTDILKMTRYIIEKYPEVLDRTSKPFLVDSEREIIPNTNPILGRIPGVDGLKTGFTNKAGYCLVSTLLKEKQDENEEDLRLIGIIMGTNGEKARGELSYKFMDYAASKYSDKILLDKDIKIKTIDDNKLKNRSMDIYPEEEFRKVVSKDNNISIEVELVERMKYPIRVGSNIGRVRVIENNQAIFETGLTVNEKVKRANIITRLFRSLIEKILD